MNIAELAIRDDVKTIAFHDLAMDEIRAMLEHTRKVGEIFGYDNKTYIDEVTSLHNCLSALFRVAWSRNSYVTKDSNLSLYVQEGDVFVFGMIFFRDRTYDNPPEGYVQPGTWSLHS
jgi:hypothetical protein